MPVIDCSVALPSSPAAGAPPFTSAAAEGAFSGDRSPLDSQGASASRGNAAVPSPTANAVPLDDTAESAPDTAATLAQTFARRAEVLLLAQQSQQQMMQSQLDRMKDEFNATQEERTEQLREMNALRDMALAQAKQDDEVLKKYIAMI